MNKRSFSFLSLVSILLIVLSLSVSAALAADYMHFVSSSPQQQAPSPTPIPLEPTSIPPDRVLPQVGSNAGLLIGVSVLVLIVIGGVVWSSRWGKKH